ncbi:transport and Golgi organization protein 2 homolog isoform X2 [Palaemon carinicauda]|uniref:transport and Golgi organization protein 2 homolog isoform X2 n=1 Tax=Palaemon carinicauda TaxID=392227 RepID=UPI0035B59BB7
MIMCLLFMYVNPSINEGSYKLVLVNNRDETYDRPTKPAHFWSTKVLGGMDNEKGREGGTWLGVEERGKVACLLNIFQPKDSFFRNCAGRGFLVVDFLLGTESGLDYMENIFKSGTLYNPFHLVTIEPNSTSYDAAVYSSQQKVWKALEPGFHGFGNCPVDKPFKKVVKGEKHFKGIVEKYGKIEDEELLINELFSMMQDQEENFPDQQLLEQGKGHPTSFIKGLSSIWVSCASVRYGTRTTTVILVDHKDRIFYKERTMKEPVDTENTEWQISEYSFKRKGNDS